MNHLTIFKIALAVALAIPARICGQVIQTYEGALDGSAGVAIDDELFASASDEDNVIRVYSRNKGGKPILELDLAKFLNLKPRSKETDIEAAARIGDRIYWITSHGRNKDGERQPNRLRFFATEVKRKNQTVRLAPEGKPYKDLLENLIAAPQLKEFNLAAASTRAPKMPEALNIEGLSATGNGTLLIGFRNPIPGGRALLVPLLNPDETIHGNSAKLGAPLLLDLGGLGVRDITFWQGEHIIIGGPIAGGGPFRLFRWSGGNTQPKAVENVHLDKLHPEAIVIYPDKGLNEIQLLSDDSSDESNAGPGSKKTFRSTWVKP